MNKPDTFRFINPTLLFLLAVGLFMLVSSQTEAKPSQFQSPFDEHSAENAAIEHEAPPEEEAPQPAEAPAEQQPAEPTPTPTPTSTPTPTPTPTITLTPLPTLPPEFPTSTPRPQVLEFEPPVPPKPPAEGSQDYVFDEVEFIDTMVIIGSWFWLCCGLIILISVPLILLIVQVRGSSKLRRQKRKKRRAE